MNTEKSYPAGLIAMVLCCAVVLLPGGAGAFQRRVQVQQVTTVSGKTVCLGDIATISGDLAFIEKASGIVIGNTPQPGRERQFKKAQVTARLKQHGLNVKKITLDCPRQFEIVAAFQDVARDQIENITRRFLREHMPWKQELVSIKNIDAKTLRLPGGKLSHNVRFSKNEDFLGRFSVEIAFLVEGRLADKAKVSGYMSVIAPVIVSSRHLKRHEVIKADDVTAEGRDLSLLAKNTVRAASDIIGKRAKGNIPAGTVLKYGLLEDAPVVHKGDRLTLFVESPVFTISAPGQALASGTIGDIIPVTNLSSGEKIYGFVKGDKKIEVKY